MVGSRPTPTALATLFVSNRRETMPLQGTAISQLRIGGSALLSPADAVSPRFGDSGGDGRDRCPRMARGASVHAPRNSRNLNHYGDRRIEGPGDRRLARVRPGGLRNAAAGAARLDEGLGMMLRRAGLGLIVGAVLMAPTAASAGPALVFEPFNGTVFYAEDPDAAVVPRLAHQADDGLRRLPGAEGRHGQARHQGHLLQEGDGASTE